jgi:hypothetical protein
MAKTNRISCDHRPGRLQPHPPLLLGHTPVERQGLPIIKEGNRSFHEQCAGFALAAPTAAKSLGAYGCGR